MARRAVDEKLAKYRAMRDFKKTAEPSGATAPRSAGNSFVIQKHAARRLHYDFRLELDGVLLSWSVPKGPSLSPTEKRLAVRTEDQQPQPPEDLISLVKRLPLGFELTNLDKVLYPEQNITKAQLVAYVAVVADWMLPQLANRPLTLVRCPEGRHKPCFFQKKLFPGSPPAIQTVDIEEEDGEVVEYMRVVDMPGLVGLAQLGTLEIHTWGCHADKVERPDLMVFDLDPDPTVEWDRVALAAFDVRRRLDDLGLASFVKTTGGKGLHVCAPIRRTLDWDRFKAFTKAFADQMARDEPTLYTSNVSKAARKHKIFVDYLRNGRNATFIAPYSPRAREGAPVATPIAWEELAQGVDPTSLTTQTVPARLTTLARDPWHGIDDVDQAITAAAWRGVGGKPR